MRGSGEVQRGGRYVKLHKNAVIKSLEVKVLHDEACRLFMRCETAKLSSLADKSCHVLAGI